MPHAFPTMQTQRECWFTFKKTITFVCTFIRRTLCPSTTFSYVRQQFQDINPWAMTKDLHQTNYSSNVTKGQNNVSGPKALQNISPHSPKMQGGCWSMRAGDKVDHRTLSLSHDSNTIHQPPSINVDTSQSEIFIIWGSENIQAEDTESYSVNIIIIIVLIIVIITIVAVCLFYLLFTIHYVLHVRSVFWPHFYKKRQHTDFHLHKKRQECVWVSECVVLCRLQGDTWVSDMRTVTYAISRLMCVCVKWVRVSLLVFLATSERKQKCSCNWSVALSQHFDVHWNRKSSIVSGALKTDKSLVFICTLMLFVPLFDSDGKQSLGGHGSDKQMWMCTFIDVCDCANVSKLWEDHVTFLPTHSHTITSVLSALPAGNEH